MINFIFYVTFILFTFAAAASKSRDINYDTPVKGIVNDLIENWEPPFAYLKRRGYLSKDLPSPDLQDFPQQLQWDLGQQRPLEKDSKRGLAKKENDLDSRDLRSFDETKHEDLKNMFYDLFSSQKDSASDELKSKLNVDWDMNALKYSAKESADKYVKSLNEPAEKKDQDEELFIKKRLAQDPPLKKRLAQDPPLKKRLAQDPPLRNRLAQDPPLKKHLAQDPLLSNRLAQDPLLNNRLAQDPPLNNRLTRNLPLKKRLAQDPPLKSPLAQDPSLKNPMAQDLLHEQHLSFNNPKFPKVLRIMKRAIRRSQLQKQLENQAKYFQNEPLQNLQY